MKKNEAMAQAESQSLKLQDDAAAKREILQELSEREGRVLGEIESATNQLNVGNLFHNILTVELIILQDLIQKEAESQQNFRKAKSKFDEALASSAASKGENAVLTCLTKLRDLGKLKGFIGRLGNLGTIADEYDVAISTAGPGLNNMVVDTVETAQSCIEVLRKGNVGRANFFILNQLNDKNMGHIETPENASRLFDLIKPKAPEYRAAFFKALGNTLVAKDLEQANRLAFGVKERWRVVTLDGNLVEATGAMTGGGNRVAKGIMKSKLDESVSPEVLARYKTDLSEIEQQCQHLSAEISARKSESQNFSKNKSAIEMEIKKSRMDMSTIEKKIIESKKLIDQLR